MKHYYLTDNNGNKIDVLPVIVRRPRMKNFSFLFTEMVDTISRLESAESKAILLIMMKMRRNNLFFRSDLQEYYSKQRTTQILQTLQDKGLIKRLGYGEYLFCPYLGFKGSSDCLGKVIANWEGDAGTPSTGAEDKVSAPVDNLRETG